MKLKPTSFDPLKKSIIIAFTLLLLPMLFPYRLLSIQKQGEAQSRQLQQLEVIRAWPTSAKRFALVIGVDQYADTQITTLGGASNDARSLAEALGRYAGFPQDQITLLASDQPAERQPTRGNILRRLSNLAAVVPPDGLLLISFAGHGMERGGQAFLLPADAQASNDVDLLEQTAINVTQIKDRVRKIKVGQVLLILDACRNDPVGRADSDNPLKPSYTRGFNFDVRNREVIAFATIYATALGHRAYEYKEKRQGYFTWELVEGLKGGAANETGEVTLAGLVKYLQERVPRHVLLDLGPGKEQRPFAVIEGYRADELVIAVSNPAGASGKPPTQMPLDPAAIELSYWETIKNSTNPEEFQAYLKTYPNGRFADIARIRAQQAAPQANSKKGKKSGKVYLSSSIKYSRGPSRSTTLDDFTGPFSRALAKENLNPTQELEVSFTTMSRLRGLIEDLESGYYAAGRSIPFALIIKATLTVTELQPYGGLYVAEANGSVKAIDTDSGQIVTLHIISGARGFGNTKEQAEKNSLENAAANIPETFIQLVVANAR
jgi:hypothetical protein